MCLHSPHAHSNVLFEQSLERIIELFATSQLININEKTGTGEKCPDNRIVRIIEVWIVEVRLYCVLYLLLKLKRGCYQTFEFYCFVTAFIESCVDRAAS